MSNGFKTCCIRKLIHFRVAPASFLLISPNLLVLFMFGFVSQNLCVRSIAVIMWWWADVNYIMKQMFLWNKNEIWSNKNTDGINAGGHTVNVCWDRVHVCLFWWWPNVPTRIGISVCDLVGTFSWSPWGKLTERERQTDRPALTVTALTNCSRQLLLPTTSARLVFFISLSTVFWNTHNKPTCLWQSKRLI